MEGEQKVNLKTADEKGLRDCKAPWPKQEKELLDAIRSLVDRRHDYGTCVYAMSISAVAAFNYVAHKLGVTGFQASCADLDILTRTRSLKIFRIVDFEQMLYPQSEDRFANTISADTWKWLQEEAAKLLKEREGHPDVRAHWESIVAGVVPFGYRVE